MKCPKCGYEEDLVELLKRLNKDEIQELLGMISLITDPLGQELLKRAIE